MLPLPTISTPSIPQREQFTPQVVVETRLLCPVEAELYGRDVGLRVHAPQHRPGTVIKPPCVIRLQPTAVDSPIPAPAPASSGEPGAGYCT